MTLSPSSRLGTYEILGPLGAGGMGEVYRARDLRLGREVAVKVLSGEIAASGASLARFEREARTVAGLNHPNIVTLFSVEDEDGIRFLTMELVEGQTLADLVVPGGLPFHRLVDLSIQVAEALVAAHERGVIHRDLKPGNVMVTRDGRVKVLDFGLARMAAGDSPEGTRTLTRPIPNTAEGSIQGTAPYMAPEQIRGEATDTRTDLFALGVTLYELATGGRPFVGKTPIDVTSSITPIDVTSSILRDEPEPLLRRRSDLPRGLERIVGRLLAKNPRERFQTALDIVSELKLLRQTTPGPPEARAWAVRASLRSPCSRS
jgi:eukaryotic-like serine/threonine-protein kinase